MSSFDSTPTTNCGDSAVPNFANTKPFEPSDLDEEMADTFAVQVVRPQWGRDGGPTMPVHPRQESSATYTITTDSLDPQLQQALYHYLVVDAVDNAVFRAELHN